MSFFQRVLKISLLLLCQSHNTPSTAVRRWHGSPFTVPWKGDPPKVLIFEWTLIRSPASKGPLRLGFLGSHSQASWGLSYHQLILVSSLHLPFRLMRPLTSKTCYAAEDDPELIILLPLRDCEGCRHVLPWLGLYSVGDWTQGSVHARQGLHQLSSNPALDPIFENCHLLLPTSEAADSFLWRFRKSDLIIQ